MFLFCLVFAMSLCASVYMCFVVTCWEGLTSWLSFVVSAVSLSLSHWYPGSGVVRFLIFAPLLTLVHFVWYCNVLNDLLISFFSLLYRNLAFLSNTKIFIGN